MPSTVEILWVYEGMRCPNCGQSAREELNKFMCHACWAAYTKAQTRALKLGLKVPERLEWVRRVKHIAELLREYK